MDESKDRPDVIAPPPLIYLAFLGVGLGLDYLWPAAFISGSGQYVFGGALAAVGIAILATGIRQFGRAGTNVPTYLPTTALVTEGLYRWSRNPLYIGLSLTYAGLGVLIDSLWVLALLLPIFGIMHYGVIVREERYLEGKFGEPYLAYKARIRRWL
jgi:protein-S-isoprenylcysteine O-methyltransferase Ste14